jgi:reverse gyrase
MKFFRSVAEWLRYQKQKKKYKEFSKQWQEHPSQFLEEFFGMKLYWYQKLFINKIVKNKYIKY